MGENKPKLQAMELLSCVAEQGDDDFVKEPLRFVALPSVVPPKRYEYFLLYKPH